MLSQREFFLRHLAQTSDIPLALEIERAEGCYLYEKDGRKYLDLISGISVSSLGHGHNAIIEAIQEQSAKHLHLMVYGEYVQSPQNKLAELLLQTLPAPLDAVYFTNSGAEATEGAMKLAKRCTGRTGFISFKDAYHGSTQGALSLAGGEWLKSSYRPLLPDCRQITYNNFEELSSITERTAAVFIEPVQGEAGARLSESGFLQAVRSRCNETSALLVFDEIQTGMGRCGSIWAFQETGVVPDILLSGKALGGGLPLGAFISSQALMSKLSYEPVLGHITTFGGHPLSCAAGYAALSFILKENLAEEARKKELLFRKELEHSSIIAIHGKGLLLAIDLGSFERVKKFIKFCRENGVVTDWFLFNDHCVRLAPPLVISEEESKEAAAVMRNAASTLGPI